jgi:hypothetical protein
MVEHLVRKVFEFGSMRSLLRLHIDYVYTFLELSLEFVEFGLWYSNCNNCFLNNDRLNTMVYLV